MADLPPTSTGIAAHIIRARYATNLVSNSLSHIYSQPLALDPLEYGFYLVDGKVIMPTQGRNMLTVICNCGGCVCNNIWPCRVASVAYTNFCNCRK